MSTVADHPALQVLLVEDNPADADLLGLALEEAGAAVALRRVERLEGALAHLRTARTDAVLLDLNLPDASGMEGLAALREAFPSLPIVVLTGALPGAGLEAMRLGAQDYLSKGALDGHAVWRTLRHSIERQRHHERAQELATERASRKAAEAAARLLEVSYRLAEAGLTGGGTVECLRAIVHEVRAGLGTDSATLLLTSEDGRALRVEASEGLDHAEGAQVPLGAGVAGAVAVEGRARAVPVVRLEEVARPELLRLASLMATPLRIAGRTIGVLHVGTLQPRAFTPDELKMLETLGSRVALVVENARLRERTRFEQARWRSVVETMADMVCLADAEGTLRYANEALQRWLPGAPLADPQALAEYVQGHLCRPDGAPLPAEQLPLARALRGEAVREVETLHRGPGGEERIASWSASPIADAEGRLEAVVLVGHDVTERHRTEQVLREADRRKDEFLAVLSHELRNPLAPIQNSLHLLRRAPVGGEPAGRALSVIERQVGHMTRLIGDLLDVSRITRGKIRLQRERLDLREVVGRALDDQRAVFAQRGVALESRLPAGAVPVEADPTRLAQSISNLLSNAAKFTGAGGRVEVEVELEGAQARVRVRDSGVGIGPEMMGQLFQPFVQADRTLDRSAGGLGLGLALVKGLVELHGGSVEARSAGPNQGAEFALRLPLRLEAPEPRPPAPLSEFREGLAAPSRRVLIIEDNVDAALSLKEALELERHEVEVAFAGPEGLLKARAFGPDVVLCDIGLPGLDGYAVARRLREDPQLSSRYLVALTGYAQPEDRRRAREAGFDLHLAKPLDFGALERALGDCCAG